MRNQWKAVLLRGTDGVKLSRRQMVASSVTIAAAVAATAVGGKTVALHAEEAKPAVAPDGKLAEVHIDNFSFSPAELTIAPGTTVKWTNRDDIPHTVVEKGTAWKSKVMDTDESYERKFDTAGEVEYFCSLHPHMKAKIIVK